MEFESGQAMNTIHSLLSEKDASYRYKFWCHTCQRILVEKFGKLEGKDGALPPTLFHYTNINGVYEILKSQDTEIPNLRFTTLGDLNDSTELKIGCNLIIDYLEKHCAPHELICIAREIPNLAETFAIVALSECSDDIPLWMAYGDRGKGVAIGLETETLLLSRGVSLVPVIYDEKLQEEFIEGLVVDLIGWLDVEFLGGLRSGQRQNLQRVIATAALMIKHPKWSFEREWRLVFGNIVQNVEMVHGQLRRLEYRTLQGLVEDSVEYYINEFEMSAEQAILMVGSKRNPITEIIIGSCLHKSQEQNIRFMLDERHLEEVTITPSECPIQ